MWMLLPQTPTPEPRILESRAKPRFIYVDANHAEEAAGGQKSGRASASSIAYLVAEAPSAVHVQRSSFSLLLPWPEAA